MYANMLANVNEFSRRVVATRAKPPAIYQTLAINRASLNGLLFVKLHKQEHAS